MNNLLDTVSTIDGQALAPDELEKLVLTRAQLMYHVRRREASQRELHAHLEACERQGLANVTIAKMCIGAGALACARGDYRGARVPFNRALGIAGTIGNETLIAQAAAQLALCAFRTGEYDRVEEWSKQALSAFGPTFSGYNEIQVAYYSSFAASLRGDDNSARDAIGRLDARMPNTVAPWMRQVWGLYRSDLLYLLRQYAVAVRFARATIDDWGVAPQDISFAGPLARWLAHLLAKDPSQPALRDALAALVARVDELDAIDKVEVIAAASLAKLEGSAVHRGGEELPTWLSVLPRPVPLQLERLGMPLKHVRAGA